MPDIDGITQAEFARRYGVKRQTIHCWVRRGRIRLLPSGLIDEADARARLAALESQEAHHQANRRRNAERRAAAGKLSAVALSLPADRDDQHELDMLRATLALTRHKAERARLEIDKARRTLVEMSEVQHVLEELDAVVHTHLEAMPGRLAPEIAEHGGNTAAVHRTLELAGREILTAIADHFEHLALGSATDGGTAA